MSNKSECIRVCVRIRPLSSKEKQDGRTYIVNADTKRASISIQNPESDAREPKKEFTFDATFPPESTQMEVYTAAATDIVEAVLSGFNGTIFAYGQTGAGKSHTMEGYNDPPELRGIIPNSFKHIFDKVNVTENKKFLVRCSYLEIYNEEIRDLLSKNPQNRLELKENVDSGVYVKDLKSITVSDVQQMDNVMQAGKKNRSVGSTLMNQTSSRSHSMFTIIVECCGEGLDGQEHICVGKLNLVDLAGSERQSKTGATGDRLKEATKINLSLSALGNVIKALVEGSGGKKHIPYRDSKLTRLLQDSLGGNAKTVMIANCGPADYNYDETLTTLRYANRAKNIKNKPKINEDPKDAMLREYQDEITRLRDELRAQEKNMTTQIIDGKPVAVQAPEKEIREKIVEKIVVQREGVSEAELEAFQARAQAEKAELRRQAQAEMKTLVATQSQREEEREALAARLRETAVEKLEMKKQQAEMVSNLEAMEAKLIVGGQLMDKAARQELELREAQSKLESQRRQERELATALAERDDSNFMLEEQYASLQDEVDTKTKKLRKLWVKHKSASSDLCDLREEFQLEKDEMLETIRELRRQIQLKKFLKENFIPEDLALNIQRRVAFDAELGEWQLQSLTEQQQRPLSGSHKGPLEAYEPPLTRFPETNFARQRRAYDSNVRYRLENVLDLELDMPESSTTESLFETQEDHGFTLRLDQIIRPDVDELLFDREDPMELMLDQLKISSSSNSPEEQPHVRQPEVTKELLATKSSDRSRRSSKRPGTARRKKELVAAEEKD